jgi:glycosyltransferase involved in cell wall biosynthesis
VLKATVVLRSYNRLTAACDALVRCLEQDYPSFEVVVIEQSTRFTPEEQARLAALAADPRVVVAKRPPLGGPGSRNEACRIASGDVILMLDDDDIPGHPGWLAAHMKNFDDPKCLAVSGRHVVEGAKEPFYKNMEFARQNVLSYSWLHWQRCFTQLDIRSDKILNIHGTNSAIRRSALERFGMWDTCTTIEDENSLCFRIQRGKRDDEYMVFDPEAWILRRLDIGGGLDKRKMSTVGFGRRLFEFLHNVVGHYHRSRFVTLYPAYMILLWYHACERIYCNESWKYEGRPWRKTVALSVFTLAFPFLWVYWAIPWAAERLTRPPPERGPQLTPSRALPDEADEVHFGNLVSEQIQ